MSKTQDAFGTAPKSVLNKPMMQVQWQIATGGTPPTLGIGEFDVPMNNILVSEIPGAGLSDPLISLPAGTYYIEAVAATRVGAAASAAARLYVTDDADTKLLIGKNGYSYGVNNNIELDVSGKITLASSGNIKLRRYSEDAGSEGWYTNQAPYEVLADLRIWKLDSNVETPVISDPTMTLARPLMHVQDQKPSGTAGGTSVAGNNDRDLNTVLVNEISGASLSSNEVTLPAGTYYAEAFSTGYDATGSYMRLLLRDSADTTLLSGENENINSSKVGNAHVGGRFTLTETTAIKLTTVHGLAEANTGLGPASSVGPYELFTDLKIWQQDAVNKQPVLVNDKLFPLPGGVIVTGNMHGLEYSYVDANNISVQPGICMDSTNENVLQLATATQVFIPAVADTVYNLFLVDDGAEPIKVDTDVDGANLPAQDKRRWIGFVTTDGTGAVHRFQQTQDEMGWVGEYGVNLSGGIDLGNVGPAGFTKLSIASAAPVSRVIKADVMIGVPTNVHCIIKYGEYYYSADQGPTSGGATISARVPVINGEVEGYASSGTAPLLLMGVRVKR